MNLKAVMGIISLFVTLPIMFYLQYKVFTLVGATEVMWLLYWVQLPLIVLLQIVTKLLESGE